VDKPSGWTSHDVVARVRRLIGQQRVGHTGTLDPLASGVLPVLLGRATRLADLVQSGRKTYVARLRLGMATDTDDAEGAVVAEQPVPSLSEPLVQEALAAFTGQIEQTPPRYSAVKIAGRRAYAIARAGGELALAPRTVTIYDLRLVDWSPELLTLEVTCSKGTYIRALARDVAARLGTVGHLASLQRTRVGPFQLSDSRGLDELAERGVASMLLPASRALPEAPSVCLDAGRAARFANGQAIHVAGLRGDDVWVYDPVGRLIGLGAADGERLKPRLAL
jgi:tRNA pseudouridine55 synthase